MRILGIEPTPSPNVMKLTIDETLPEGVSKNFTIHKKENAPEYMLRLLAIEGVTGAFQVKDFIALERHPKGNWKIILEDVHRIFATSDTISKETVDQVDSFGEIQAFVQIFKGIPIQVKVIARDEEMRFGLPERFLQATLSLSGQVIQERIWEEHGVRYGTLKEVGEQIVQEISAKYDQEALDARLQGLEEPARSEWLQNEDWEKRFAAFSRINPSVKDLNIIGQALNDPQTAIRRLAVAYLGMIDSIEVFPYLFQALKDRSAVVRRTAGDVCSDLGNPIAIAPMTEGLIDKNKLVRWRAARFLYESGDHTAVAALKKAQDDAEFEVSLQAKMALERIERGEEAQGAIWQQMVRARKK